MCGQCSWVLWGAYIKLLYTADKVIIPIDLFTPVAGYIHLELPVFHIGYFKITVKTLQCICKVCSRVLLPQEERLKYVRYRGMLLGLLVSLMWA